jgi:hypothetical protein
VEPAAGRFSVAPWITHERLDDEVMAINLETGVYFALDDVAADAWTLLVAGVGLGRVVTVLAERYEVDPDRVHSDLVIYATALEHNRLLVRDDDVGRTAPATLVELPAPTGPLEYAAPAVSRYDDLEALLRLDPVHEVDEAGWPVMRAD